MPNLEHPAYPADTLLHLESLVPCRESQVSMLLSIFGEVVLFILCVSIEQRCSAVSEGRVEI